MFDRYSGRVQSGDLYTHDDDDDDDDGGDDDSDNEPRCVSLRVT